MQTSFSVYADLYDYSSGVYEYVTGAYISAHAVKIIGWGNEDEKDYWLVANSWGTSWGLQGYFKIKMGILGIDEAVYACMANLTSVQDYYREKEIILPEY